MRPAEADSDANALTCRAERGGDAVVLHLAGTLTEDPASRRVEREIERQYVDDGVRRIRLDMHDVEAIDLEGVAVLIHLFRESERRGKVLTVEHSEGAVRRRLLTTGVLRIMEPPDEPLAESVGF
jgi:anti-anti-sigma factor